MQSGSKRKVKRPETLVVLISLKSCWFLPLNERQFAGFMLLADWTGNYGHNHRTMHPGACTSLAPLVPGTRTMFISPTIWINQCANGTNIRWRHGQLGESSFYFRLRVGFWDCSSRDLVMFCKLVNHLHPQIICINSRRLMQPFNIMMGTSQHISTISCSIFPHVRIRRLLEIEKKRQPNHVVFIFKLVN